MDIANKLKNNRKQLGLTQEEIAKKLHVSRQTVSNWETGKSIPDIYNLVELSNIYDISLDNLVKEDVVVMKEIKKDDKMGRLINRAIILGGFGIIVVIISFFIKNTHFQAFLRGLSSGIMSVSVITLIVIKVVRQIQK